MFQQTYRLLKVTPVMGIMDGALRATSTQAFFPGSTISMTWRRVVGAGYSMSKETGDVAMIDMKPLRVAMLLPVILPSSPCHAKPRTPCRLGPIGVVDATRWCPWLRQRLQLLVASNSAGVISARYSAPAPNTLSPLGGFHVGDRNEGAPKGLCHRGIQAYSVDGERDCVFWRSLVVAFIFLAR